jgi:alpha-glucoside transport system substrate-binding protein
VIAVGALAGCGSDDDADDQAPIVEVFGPVVDEPGRILADTLRDAGAGSGVTLRYVGVSSFNEQLEDRLERGDRPGIVLLSQPGLLDDLAARGVLAPVPDGVAATISSSYPADLVALTRTAEGEPAGVWLTVDVKSLVWYRPDEFDRRELAVPRTLDELAALSERVRTDSDGVAPWCLTMEAGASTGWVGTDWVEDYVLRRVGADGYQRWTDGQIPFGDPRIVAVFDELDTLLRRPGAVHGGRRSVLSVPWERTADELTADAPDCLMVHQGDFLRRELPAGTMIGPDGDVDIFQLPGTDTSTPPPLIVGGMLATPLDGSTAVATAMSILAGIDVATRLDRTGQFISPHLGVEPSTIDDAATARLLDLVAASGDIRFDGSDLMPAAVGTGTFWTGMRNFFAGSPTRSVVDEIDAGWSDDQTTPP